MHLIVIIIFYNFAHENRTYKMYYMKNIKSIITITCLILSGTTVVKAQGTQQNSNEKYAEMTFVERTHNFGIFDVKNGDKTCWFVFTNTGNKDLLILSATASCGCTVPSFPKTPIPPGGKDSIKVDYTGSTRRPGVFKKTIALKTNAKVSTDYLYIMGEMVEKVVEDRLKQQTVN